MNPKKSSPKRALKMAIDLAGGPTALVRGLRKQGIKISKSAISQWEVCPDRRAIPVEKVVEGRVTRHELCPELYPADGA